MGRSKSDPHSPSTVVWIGTVHQVADHFLSLFQLEAHARHIRANYKPRKEEHRTAIFSWPMSIVRLERFVKTIPISRSREGVFGRRERRIILKYIVIKRL
jgi:hypothetical protein